MVSCLFCQVEALEKLQLVLPCLPTREAEFSLSYLLLVSASTSVNL
uniref:60S ribosomal protein L33-B n=1 Tax=Arundo donax TaxID=35708 RepID=A0A0A9GE81_ARUDO